MAAMRLMGFRDSVGVVTKDILTCSLAARLIPRRQVRLPSAQE
jgi:hypothetical protein